MPLGVDLWTKFGRFLVPKWSQVDTTMGSKIDVKFERRFLIIRAPAAAGARKIKIWGWKLRAKTDQKSIKKRSPRWMASWHRFFLDFGRFWEASWEGNRSQDRPKKASKNDAKKKSSEIAKKVATRISNDARGRGSWVLGMKRSGWTLSSSIHSCII